MISRLKAGLISKAALFILLLAFNARGEVIGSVAFTGCEEIPCGEVSDGTLLEVGMELTRELLRNEIARIDSIYFSRGFLRADVEVDTVRIEKGISIELKLNEGQRARIGRIGVSGLGKTLVEKVKELVGVSEGDEFAPVELERGMEKVLSFMLNSGYPYAQVWMTGFSYDRESNSVDITLSVVGGKKSVIGDIVFEGVNRVDTNYAVRLTRLKKGDIFREEDVLRGVRFLSSAGCFESIGAYRIEKGTGDDVRLVIPVKEREKASSFQGVLGFAKKDDRYVLNGSIDLRLKNMGGKGREASFRWMNNGERYSSVDFSLFEPFVVGSPVNARIELSQVVQDSTFTSSYGAISVEVPVSPSHSIVTGFAGDRNIPGFGELLRSTRWRYRLGYVFSGTSAVRSLRVSIDGVLRNRWFSHGRSELDYEAVYDFDLVGTVDVTRGQSFYFRTKAAGVLAGDEIPLAEKMLLGGANSIRGYRENQFRGDEIVFSNLEYRFGLEGAFFLFDDVGAFYNRGSGWQLKNGLGFGMRSRSPIGEVALSFGVGDRVSFEGTKIHVSMYQRF